MVRLRELLSRGINGWPRIAARQTSIGLRQAHDTLEDYRQPPLWSCQSHQPLQLKGAI